MVEAVGEPRELGFVRARDAYVVLPSGHGVCGVGNRDDGTGDAATDQECGSHRGNDDRDTDNQQLLERRAYRRQHVAALRLHHEQERRSNDGRACRERFAIRMSGSHARIRDGLRRSGNAAKARPDAAIVVRVVHAHAFPRQRAHAAIRLRIGFESPQLGDTADDRTARADAPLSKLPTNVAQRTGSGSPSTRTFDRLSLTSN